MCYRNWTAAGRNHAFSRDTGHIQTMITCTGLEDFVNHRFHIDKIYKVVEGTVSGEN